MKNLRTKFNRFCLRNRDKGIPNLMLYIVITSAVVYLLTLIESTSFLYDWLCFDKIKILKGQVWRLVTFAFVMNPASGPFLTLIGFYFFYHLGRHVEAAMGTLRFNIFFFTGVLLMDAFAMILCPTSTIMVNGVPVTPEFFTYLYSDMAFYLELSLLLMFAATHPNAQFLVFFIIPIRAWFLGLVYLLLIAIQIINTDLFFPHNLFPLVGLANFLLFAGKDVLNLIPFASNVPKRKPQQPQRTGTIQFRQEGSAPKKAPAYTHRCTVCGRTDVSNPELEFRYCSRCNGYHCYCEDHINNHSHIE